MLRPHANKPFPAVMFDYTRLKIAHIFMFWALCNNFDENEDGYIEMPRLEFNRQVKRYMKRDVSNTTAILMMLAECQFISLETFADRKVTTNVGHFKIKINPKIWDVPQSNSKTSVDYNPKKTLYQAARRAKYKAKRQLLLSDDE